MLRIWFFGTPTLARRVLEDLFASEDFQVIFVVTNPDKPSGRSGKLQGNPVKDFACEKNIPLFQPQKIRSDLQLFNHIRSFDCDYSIVVAYGKILPPEILNTPKKMCINVHGSLLPKYRWASPIQSALLHWEKETGVTIMQMTEGMDEGDILSQKIIPIAPDETSESLFEKFAKISWAVLMDTIMRYENGEILPKQQEHAEATYCKKIEKEDGRIDWSKSARDIYHMWQAYTPWPGIYTIYEGKRLLLEKVSLSSCPVLPDSSKKQDAPSGTVVSCETWWVCVICGEWILKLEQIKREWKKSQSLWDFVNGNQDFLGSVLSSTLFHVDVNLSECRTAQEVQHYFSDHWFWWYGTNWDSFQDCLRSLDDDGIDGNGIKFTFPLQIHISWYQLFSQNDPTNFSLFCEIFSRQEIEWKNHGKYLEVSFL